MPSYAGVTFSVQKETPARTFQRPYQWSRRAIPFSDTEDIQYLGSGKFTLALAVILTGADVVTLRAAVGETGRTLSDFRSGSYNGVRLMSISNERFVQDGGGTTYLADLEFVWEG